MWSHSGAEPRLQVNRRKDIRYGKSQSGLLYKQKEGDEKNSVDNVEDAFNLDKRR